MRLNFSSALAVIASMTLSASLLSAGEWQDLTGKTLDDHWTTAGAWTFKDGVFHLPNQDHKTWTHYDRYLILKGHLVTDFEFECEWKTEGNSGIYFHIPDLANVPERKHVEVQIYENSKWTKPELGDHAAGGIIPGHAPTKDACKPYGEWNKMHLKCVDNKIVVTLNGQVVNEVNLSEGKTAERSKIGGFAFQDHGFETSIRNIRLKSLDE